MLENTDIYQMRYLGKYGLAKWGLVLVQYRDTVNDESAHHLQDTSFTQVLFNYAISCTW